LRCWRSPAYAQESGQIEPGRFLVYFDTDQATLGPGATQVVTEAAQAYQQTGAAQIEVIGYTDTTGSAEYNLALSQRRAETVADERRPVLKRVPPGGGMAPTMGGTSSREHGRGD
jgi:outer membrane protein OmpA-like peptidoglycan-associated protein